MFFYKFCNIFFSTFGLFPNLLHSERPKLYAILVFLSAIGLNKSICKFFPLSVDPNEKKGKEALLEWLALKVIHLTQMSLLLAND